MVFELLIVTQDYLQHIFGGLRIGLIEARHGGAQDGLVTVGRVEFEAFVEILRIVV